MRGVREQLRGALAGLAAAGWALACGPDAAPEPPEPLPATSSELLQRPTRPFKGDLEALRERHFVRALVVRDRSSFFIERGRPRGFQYELMRQYEVFLNRDRQPCEVEIRVIFVTLPFDDLLPALLEGRGDVAAAPLTITPERAARVAFTRPYLVAVDEVVVSGPAAPHLATIDELAGRTVHVVRGSSHGPHLRELSHDLERRGLAAIEVVETDKHLRVEDLFELVHAGVFEHTVADRYLAELWAGVLPDLIVREDLVTRAGGDIAWAVRKQSPKLRASLNEFLRKHRKGTLLGNVLFQRYYGGTRWIANPLAPDEARKLSRYDDLFRKYAEQYDFDWLAIAAQAYQESGLDPGRRSAAGAVGIMQLLPSTAADPVVGIPDIDDPERNIHAGTRYMAFLRDRYFSDPAIDPAARFDFTLAAYNAGPARVQRLRRRTTEMGLDPDIWFNNVELAALDVVGREPVRYVANVNKYYIAYKLAKRDEAERNRQRRQVHSATD